MSKAKKEKAPRRKPTPIRGREGEGAPEGGKKKLPLKMMIIAGAARWWCWAAAAWAPC